MKGGRHNNFFFFVNKKIEEKIKIRQEGNNMECRKLS